MKVLLESTFEKIARIIGRSYNVEVYFEGDQAKTDGKKVILPRFAKMTPALELDLNGYLDHEVSHIKYTDFKEGEKVISQYHHKLLNGVEDIRIEKLMMIEYPGTSLHLLPLRAKIRKQESDEYEKIPWTGKIIMACMDYMKGDKIAKHPEIDRHIISIQPELDKLLKCKSTKELRVVTEEICKKLVQDREEEKKESEKQENGESEESEENQEQNSDNSDSETQDGEGQESDNGKESKKQNGKGKGQGKPKVDPKVSKEKEKFDDMLDKDYEKKQAQKGEKNLIDALKSDIGEMIKAQIEKEVKKQEQEIKNMKMEYDYSEGSTVESIPTTTKFDKVVDFNGKDNDRVKYSTLKSKVSPMVNTLAQKLEEIFKVVENSRWKTERESGLINARSLSQLSSNPNYRTVFKEKLKNETNNLAISILVDLSGSMRGDKVETARLTATAMSESLSKLNIAHEVCGFNTDGSEEMRRFSAHSGKLTYFSRTTENLVHFVFKSFDNQDLRGIANMQSDGANNDGESVFWCAQRLAERNEKRKILIVLSDGMPAGEPNSRILQSDLRLKLAKIEKAGIETVGIGIQTDAVKHFYKDYLVINNLKDLTGQALSKLSSILLKNFKM